MKQEATLLCLVGKATSPPFVDRIDCSEGGTQPAGAPSTLSTGASSTVSAATGASPNGQTPTSGASCPWLDEAGEANINIDSTTTTDSTTAQIQLQLQLQLLYLATYLNVQKLKAMKH